MPSSTTKGVPFPLGSDSVSTLDTTIQDLAEWVDDQPGIATLTTVQRDALTGADLWTGRTIWNSNNSRIENYDGVSWVAEVTTGNIANLAVTTAKIADGAVTNAKIADGAVTNAKADFIWTSYTPVVGAGTIGNGSASGSHCRMGDLVFFRVMVSIGTTTTAMTNGFTVTLPPFSADIAPGTGVTCSKWSGSGGADEVVPAKITASGVVEIGANTASGFTDALYIAGFYEAV